MAPSSLELLLKPVYDPNFITVFVISIIAFILIDKMAEMVFNRNLTKISTNDKSNFICYAQSMIHHSIMPIPAYLAIYNQKQYGDFYDYFTIISCAHYLIAIFWEYLTKYESTFEKIVMILHHIICALMQYPSYSLHSAIYTYTSALSFQCEIGNSFRTIQWFAEQFKNEKLYKLTGVIHLISFPLTRLIPFPIALYKVYSSYQTNAYIPITYYWLILIGGTAIVILSVAHTVIMWMNPTKWVKLDINVDNSGDNDNMSVVIKPLLENENSEQQYD